MNAPGAIRRVAFVGAGQMGLGMLANLVRKGFEVLAADRSAEALERARAEGATPVASLPEAARLCDALVSMLPTAQVVRDVYLGPDGVAASARPGSACIDMSTIDPGTAIAVGSRLRQAGVDFMDCPVSGGGPKARAGTLTVMAGGSAAALERLRPLLAAIGTDIVHVGPLGSGSAAKLANNIVAAASMVATSEAFRVGTAYGIDPTLLTRILETSSGDTWILRNMHPVPGMREGSPSSNGYDPGFSTINMIEMLDLIRLAAFEKHVPLAVVPALQTVWQLASNHGLAERDCTSVYQFMQPASLPDAGKPQEENR